MPVPGDEEVEGALDVDRPRTRGECPVERPCPWVSCAMHLYLDSNPKTGSIKLNFPELEPWEIEQSCALDVADEGEHTLEEVGALLNLTRERIRQLEVRALLKLQAESGAELRPEGRPLPIGERRCRKCPTPIRAHNKSGLCRVCYKRAWSSQRGRERSAGALVGPGRRCSEPGCNRRHQARGLCRRHYGQRRYAGTLPGKGLT